MNPNTAGVITPDTESKRKAITRYQLTWRPAFLSSESSAYVLGEDLKFNQVGSPVENPAELNARITNLQDLINLGVTNEIILPLNTNLALAQEYSPSIKNKVVTYETIGGNSITTFGEAVRNLGMRIRIIRLGSGWEIYYKGLEALSYLSGNQSRYYGSVYLTSYDSFKDNNYQISSRYKVTILSLDFSFRSDENTTISADLRMLVNQDFSNFNRRAWGNL